MSTARITCKVLPGLFENEYYVMVNGSSGYYINAANLVTLSGTPRQDVAVDGVVRGYIIEANPTKTLVQLPGEVVVGGMRTWVSNEAVAAD